MTQTEAQVLCMVFSFRSFNASSEGTTLHLVTQMYTPTGGESTRQVVNPWIADLNQNTNNTTTTSDGPNDRFDVAEVEQQKAYVPDMVNTFVVDEYDDFKDNPVLFYATAWTVGSLNIEVTQDLFQDYVGLALANLSFMAKKLANFAFVKSDLRVTVVVQGNSVAQGKMVISFEPLPNANDQSTAIHHVPAPQATRAMLLPHLEIDPAESKTYTIDLPCPTIWGLYSLNRVYAINQSWGSYRMKQHIINPLGSGTAVVPAIDVAVYLSLVKPSLVAATANTTFALTSALKKEKTDGSGGVISGYFKKASSIASVVSMVPVPMISEAATLFGGVSESVGNFLAWFGYSKPLVQDVGHCLISTDENWTKIDNTIRAQSLAFRSNASVGLSGASCPLYDPRDSIISNLAAKKSLIRTFSIPVVTSPNTLITTIEVNPMASRLLDDPAVGNGFELTPLAFVSYPYRYWRADMEYDIEFVCSVFHRATVIVLYDPASAALSGAINRYMSVLQHWTYQVSGHSRHSIVIPWKQQMAMKRVGVPFSSVGGASAINSASNGNIYFALLNSVTTNGSTDPIHVNVYMSGSNLRLGGTTSRSYTPVIISPPSLMAGEDEKVVDPLESEELQEEFSYTSAIKSQDDVGFFRQYFGEEQAHTVKELASRQTALVHLVWLAIGAATEARTFFLPNGQLLSTDFVAANFAGSINWGSTSPTAGRCLVDYLSTAYVGVRGSYDYSIFPNGGYDEPVDATAVHNEYGNVPVSVVSGGVMPGPSWHGLALQYGLINPSVQVNSPFYYQGMFRPCSQTYFGTNDGISVKMLYSANTSVPAHTTVVLKSGGDDFMFVGFRGMPTMIYNA